MSPPPEPTTEPSEEVQILEFSLGEETYAISIEYIEEIADVRDLSPIPNSPSHVIGVMDLRGRTTAVIDPKRLFDVAGPGGGERVLVFDPDRIEDGQAIGWTVDAVHRVVSVDPDDVEPAPATDMPALLGLLRGADSFVIWVDPTATGV